MISSTSLHSDPERGAQTSGPDSSKSSELSFSMAAEPQEIKDAADSALHDNSHASGELILLDVSKGICLQSELRRLEQELIKQALILTEGHQRLAAQLLGIKPTTLHSKIKKFSLLEEKLAPPQD